QGLAVGGGRLRGLGSGRVALDVVEGHSGPVAEGRTGTTGSGERGRILAGDGVAFEVGEVENTLALQSDVHRRDAAVGEVRNDDPEFERKLRVELTVGRVEGATEIAGCAQAE